MRKIYAIAVITVRNAIRSRVVASLLVMLALVIVGLPLTVKSDGTISGQVQVILTYALSGVGILLSIATIWAACAAVSQEIAERQIHLVVTKPVSRTQVWIGKWLGLVAMNFLLIAISGAAVYGSLKWRTSRAILTEAGEKELREEVLVARHVVEPDLVNVDAQARALLKERLDAGVLPETLAEEDALELIRQGLLAQIYSAAQGGRVSWSFEVPRDTQMDRPLQIRFKLSSSAVVAETVPGRWIAGPAEFEEVFTYREDSTPVGFHTFAVPGEAVSDDGRLVITYVNASERPVTVLFPPTDGMRLLTHAGGFEMNLVRALLIQFFHLAFLTALGVTAGSMFSMPVAALFSVYSMVLIRVTPYIHDMAIRRTFFASQGEQQAPSAFDLVTRWFFQLMDFLLSPLQTASPLDMLGVGELVSWGWVASVFLVKVVLYGTAVAAIGAAILNRRELGLPS